MKVKTLLYFDVINVLKNIKVFNKSIYKSKSWSAVMETFIKSLKSKAMNV